MAFSNDQLRRVKGTVLVLGLTVVAIVALVGVLLSGVLTPPAESAAPEDTPAVSDGGSIASMEDVDALYGAATERLEAQYDADASNPSALLDLANGYFDWGAAAMHYRGTDEADAHVRDLFQRAIELYDRYLAEHPGSKSVEVDRAISVFYGGDAEGAIAALEAFTAEDGTFGPAWANLGMFYEAEGRIEDAAAAYGRAVEADPDDTYHVKTYAQQRLDALREN